MHDFDVFDKLERVFEQHTWAFMAHQAELSLFGMRVFKQNVVNTTRKHVRKDLLLSRFP